MNLRSNYVEYQMAVAAKRNGLRPICDRISSTMREILLEDLLEDESCKRDQKTNILPYAKE